MFAPPAGLSAVMLAVLELMLSVLGRKILAVCLAKGSLGVTLNVSPK